MEYCDGYQGRILGQKIHFFCLKVFKNTVILNEAGATLKRRDQLLLIPLYAAIDATIYRYRYRRSKRNAQKARDGSYVK